MNLLAIILLVCSLVCIGAMFVRAANKAPFMDDEGRITDEHGVPLQKPAPPVVEPPKQHLSRLHPSVRAAMGRRE